MAGFLYFISSESQAVTPELLKAAGMGYAIEEGANFTPINVSSGPGGQAGFLIAIGDNPPPAYEPQSQTWRKGPAGANGGGKFWVGINNGEPIGPDDLARSRVISGETVRLRDGNEWTIPICLSIVRGNTLPKALVLGENGEAWTLETLPEFVKLCKDAETVWEAFRVSENGAVRMDAQEAPRIAADAMAVNYRIGPAEISLLRLWSTSEMWDVLKAIIDAPMLTRLAKEAAEKNALPSGA